MESTAEAGAVRRVPQAAGPLGEPPAVHSCLQRLYQGWQCQQRLCPGRRTVFHNPKP